MSKLPDTQVHLEAAVYAVSDTKRVSLKDLLGSFQRHGTARISDLHLKTGLPPVFRVDGDLRTTGGNALDESTMLALAQNTLTEPELQTLAKHRSVNCSHLVNNMRYRFNWFYDRNGLAVAIRALDTRVPTVEEVGFPNRVWEDIIELRAGLVLLTGATGSGKSTTIASLLTRIAAVRACHIITLEDPIEYQLEGKLGLISQRAIGRDVPSYERGLRDCLREDPDVIFVGEMTDAESANWTLTAAETGHLVFSGLHTRDTAGTITRLLDMYPPSRTEEVANQLSLSLRYILSQKLLPKAEGSGRVLAMEVLNNNFAISNLIRQLKPEQVFSILQTQTRDAPEQRMISMERSLANLVRGNRVTLQEAERACNHPQVLADELQRDER